MHYAYLLKLSNGNYYAGSTQDLKLRLKKHQAGEVAHTSKHRPIEIVWYSAFANKETATAFEKYLKTSSGKAFRNKRLLANHQSLSVAPNIS